MNIYSSNANPVSSVNETTLRFPRTLSEAFADERAVAIRHYRPSHRIADSAVMAACAVGAVAVVLTIIFGVAP